jgi:hypothetical protein
MADDDRSRVGDQWTFVAPDPDMWKQPTGLSVAMSITAK